MPARRQLRTNRVASTVAALATLWFVSGQWIGRRGTVGGSGVHRCATTAADHMEP